MNSVRGFLVRGGIGDIRRHDEHSDTAFRQRGLARCDGLAPSLLGRQDHLAIDAAALEHVVVLDLLDRLESQVPPHDLGCDQDDRRAVAIGFIEAVDEVETAGAAASCAGCKAAGEQRFGRCRKGARLFMPHMDPIDLAAVDGVRDLVHRVADDPVARLHAGFLQRFDQ
jgi:hypothetical protein